MVDAFISHVGGRFGTCAAASEAVASSPSHPQLRLLVEGRISSWARAA